MSVTFLYYLIAIVLALVGLIGTVLPALPGLPLVFAGLLLAAWTDDFRRVDVATVVVLGLLTLLSLAIDVLATALGAQRVGASRLALIGAVLGTFAGLFLGPLGLVAGPFVGTLAGELLHGRRLGAQPLGQAVKVGLGTWIGMLLAVVLQLTLAFAMIGMFMLAWWF